MAKKKKKSDYKASSAVYAVEKVLAVAEKKDPETLAIVNKALRATVRALDKNINKLVKVEQIHATSDHELLAQFVLTALENDKSLKS